jgi:mannose-6-phosphate isomerase-like protein (cupin superfamily)
MAIALDDKFALFDAHWSPHIVAALNDLHIKLVKVRGEFVWHAHADTDELFFVHKGELNIQYRNRDNIVRAGEMFVVPKGVEHRPFAAEECEILLIEPSGTVNTGDAGGDMTAHAEPWI